LQLRIRAIQISLANVADLTLKGRSENPLIPASAEVMGAS
jgi:hypothetical protein